MHSIRLNFQEGDPPSLHPHLTNTHIRCNSLGKLLFECLTRINQKAEVDLAGAKSVEISEDGLRYVFTLRDNRWSDGSLVTAFQYEAAWKAAVHPDSLCNRADLFYPIKNAEEIKKKELPLNSLGVKALDEKTLQIELSFPCPAFLKLLAAPVFAPLKNPEGEPNIFNGSFTVALWEKTRQLQLTKNPFFWNRENVFLETVNISFVMENATALYLYEKGEIDWVGSPVSTLPMEAVPVLENQKTLRKRISSLVFWLHINTQCAPFHIPAIRQALAASLDPGKINEHILIGIPTASPLPASISLNPALTEREGNAQELFARGLKEGGLTACPPIQLRYFNTPRMKALAQYLQEAWQQTLGITVKLECSDWNIFRSALEQGDFQIAGCYEAPDYPEPLNILDRFGSSSRSNFCRWTDSLFQEKLSLAKTAIDAKQRQQWLQEAERILISALPVIPISSATQIYLHPPTLKGYIFDFSGAIDFSYAYFD